MVTDPCFKISGGKMFSCLGENGNAIAILSTGSIYSSFNLSLYQYSKSLEN
jgi:hypothetical protein